MARIARPWTALGAFLIAGALTALPIDDVSAQTSTKTARPAKKAKAPPRRAVERQATPQAGPTAPGPMRDPVVDRSTGSAY